LWLKEGDANSKKKSCGMKSNWRIGNAISAVVANGKRIECVDNVIEAVFNHFDNHFKTVPLMWLGVKIFNFKSLGSEDIWG